jgi:putative ABC transport system permease protein
VKPLFRLPVRRSPEQELEDEFAFHLEMRTEELVAQGWSRAAAREEARRRFGDLEDARRYCRHTDHHRGKRLMRIELLTELRQDIGFALRALRRAPGFALVAALTLALGIGANTAIFSVVRGVLLRPLPFQDPHELVLVAASYEGRTSPYISPANAYDWRDRNQSFSSLSIVGSHSAVLTEAGDPERLRGFDVSADFFTTLGVKPVTGRLTFSPEEAAWQGPRSVILAEALWRSRFGSDSAIVNRAITLDNEQYRVVGVAPEGSTWPAGAAIWFPFTFDPAQLPGSRGAVYLNAIARLKPGVTLERAEVDMRSVAGRLAEIYPDNNAGLSATVVPLREWITGSIDRPLYILLGGVGFVLLIACANVANLLLVRGIGRESELAVRAALGAGRGRLVRQLVTENLVLSLVGALAGLALAAVGIRLLVGAAPSSIPRLGSIQLDGMVLGFTFAVALVTGLLFGILPARLVVRPDLARTLREGGRGSGRKAGSRSRRALVIAEVALSVMLLAGAGLLIRSFNRLMSVDPGFRTAGSISFSLSLPAAKYPLGPRQTDFVRGMMERMQGIPGVQAAGGAMGMPLTGFSFQFSMEVEGRPAASASDQPSAEVRIATPGYFQAMGIPIVRGRGLTPGDRSGGQPVLLLTETAAKEFFPGEDPVGKRVRFGWGRNGTRLGGEIVGVVGDVKQSSLANATLPQFWAPYDQWPVASFTVVLHASGPLDQVVTDARRILRELDPDLAMGQVRSLETVLAESVAQPRFYMLLLSTFAGVAILLSGIGIYGVLAYLVGQRSREIGIRIALGATSRRVVGLVVREGTALVGAGILVGLAGALALTQLMGALLFGVEPSDPLTYGLVTALLAVVALAACWIPARRASRVDPATTMRTE